MASSHLAFVLWQEFKVIEEGEPVAVSGPSRRGIVTGLVRLDCARRVTVLVRVRLAVVLQGGPGAHPGNRAQNVDELDVIGGRTPRRKAEVAGPHCSEHLVGARRTSGAERKQGPRLDQEAAMVAKEVDRGQRILPIIAAQATA
jgi:hypothetical protein